MRAAVDIAQTAGWQVRRAMPRGPGHLLLDLTDDAGRSVAGQWFDDPARAARTADATRRAIGGRRVAGDRDVRTPDVRLVGQRLLLQPGGADRRLPALRELLSGEATELVAHRPERRGVVRRDPDDRSEGDPSIWGRQTGVRYSKVVRADRLDEVLAGLAAGRKSGLNTPRIIGLDRDRGVVTTAALPGRTLHSLLADTVLPTGPVPVSPTGSWARVGAALGAALRVLHLAPITPTVGHDAVAELAVVQRWLTLAELDGLLDPAAPTFRRALAAARRGLANGPGQVGTVHRDLHDKQVLLTERTEVGLLDLDLLSAGDPAMDVANLLVHLELRVRQGRADPACAGACAAGVLSGYRQRSPGVEPAAGFAPVLSDAASASPGWADSVLANVPGYAWATRLRLAALYAFRPSSAAAARSLITDPRPLADGLV